MKYVVHTSTINPIKERETRPTYTFDSFIIIFFRLRVINRRLENNYTTSSSILILIPDKKELVERNISYTEKDIILKGMNRVQWCCE